MRNSSSNAKPIVVFSRKMPIVFGPLSNDVMKLTRLKFKLNFYLNRSLLPEKELLPEKPVYCPFQNVVWSLDDLSAT